MDLHKKMALSNLWEIGIEEKQIENLDVLLLPENHGSADTKNLFDSQDAITFGKLLKKEGVKCANSYDLGLDLPTMERKSNDIWIGQLYVLNDFILPVITGVIGSLLAPLISQWKSRKDLRAPAGNAHAEITIVRPEGDIKIFYNGEPEALVKIIKSLEKEKQQGND